MKKEYIVISILAMFSVTLLGQKVSLDTVKIVAENAHKSMLEKTIPDAKILEIIPLSMEDPSIGHIINFSDSSFVIVSGDYAVKPYLGGSTSTLFSFEDAPPGLLYLMSKYEYGIKHIRKNAIMAKNETKQQWNSIVKGSMIAKSKSSVSPLLNTTWSQGPNYNYYCPYDASAGENTPAGCTAIALAQILRYWECRVDAQGSKSYTSDYGTLSVNFGTSTYDWVDMNDHSSNTENRWLIYSAGVSIETDYEIGGSSVSNPSICEDALEDYWGFKSSTTHEFRIWHLSTWEDDLIDDLDEGRPILYSGGSLSGGHSWVIDGYDSNGDFHCNWGWGGTYDDYYSLGDFTPGSYNFDQIESAVFKAQPIRDVGLEEPNLVAQDFTPGTGTVSIDACDGATSYEWTTDNGTIFSPTTNPSTTLTTWTHSEICVRAFNTLCNTYSTWDCEDFSVQLATPVFNDTPDIICNYYSDYIGINSVPNATSYTYTATGGFELFDMGDYSYKTSVTTTYRSIEVSAPSSGSGGGTVTVKANRSGTPSSELASHSIWYGKPGQPTTNPTWFPIHQMYDGDFLTVTVSNAPGASSTSYNWSTSGVLSRMSSTPYQSCLVRATSTGSGYFYVTSTNSCGTSPQGGGEVYASSPGGQQQLSVTPNPASEEIQITIIDSDSFDLAKSSSKDSNTELRPFRIINTIGAEIYNGIIEGSVVKLDVSTWPEGIYFLISNQNDEKIQNTFVVER